MKTKYNAKHFFKLILSSCKGSILTVSVIIVLSLLYFPVTSMATDLSGNLNAIDTLKLVDSPFTVIANISWTSGTHVIEPGVVFMFNPNTGFEIAQANVKCEGTVSDSIVFTSTGGTLGTWNGVYFSNNSDNGVSSTMSYTRIEKAGNGTWNSNLYCASTIMPNISYSSFIEADGNGIRLDYSPRTMSECVMELNSIGLNINYPNGTITTYLNSCTIQNNTNTGLRCNSFIELTNSLITNNTVYEVDAFAPNGFPLLINSFIQEDGTSMNRVGAGTQSVDRTWPYNSNGYEITGVVNINKSASNPRLTINAGSTLRFETAGKITIGNSSSYGGELHALGTVDSVITFTALNPAGNWEGIQFSDGSDSYSASSSMQYCTVEKGNSYNVYCINNYNAVVFDNCEFNNAAGEGIEMYNAAITVNNSLFQNNHTGLYLNSGSGITYLDNCTVQNNTNTGISSNVFIELTNSLITNNNVYEVDAFGPNGFPLLNNSFIQEDGTSINRIGGGIQSVDRTWPYNSNGYEITGVVNINKSASSPRLTINAGSTLRFETAGKITIGNSSSYGGELHAMGTADSMITFTAINPVNNWEGIAFNDGSDSFGASSNMKYCIVEKGNSYNVYCVNNYNAVVFDNCEFNNAAGEGIEMYNAAITVNNSLFQNNHTGLSLTSSNVNFITYLDNCTIQNNTNTGIRSNSFIEMTNSLITNNTVYEVDAFAPNGFPLLTNSSILEDATSVNRVGAGTQSVDRTWPYNSNGYEITGVVNINKSASNPRLTIYAGSTLRFETAGKITIGNSSSYGGELHALGTADSMIIFTALNPAGNWEGIHFNDGSDSYGATCSMQHCVIDKGNSYNVYCSNTSQPPAFKDCEISNAAGIGLNLYNSSTNLERCQVINNESYGIYINGNSNITIGNSLSKICDLYYNGVYDVYNNSANYIPAGSNFWNTSDTGLISSRIYDKYDEFLKGFVYHYPIKNSGFIPKDEFDLDGKVIYNNMDSTELNGFEIIAMDVLGNIKGTATTNASGDFSFMDLENAYYVFSGSGVTWGGSNSTDALKILQHFAFIDPLTGVNLGAADVNGSNSVNGTDALMVLQRFSALISSFPAGDWILSDTATLYGSNLTINQLASCYGDVNGSYTPPGKEVSTITLLADGSMGITSFEEYDVPINVKNGFDMGALSLILNFPEEYIEIENIILADGSTGLISNVNNGIISNAWANLNPILFDEDEVMLTIKIITKDLSGLTGNISFGLEAISEIANSDAEVIQDVILTTPQLVYGLTSTDEELEINDLAVSNYPDPFNLNTTIEYILPRDGNVLLQVFNSLGKQEEVLIDEFQIAGKYKINFDRNNLEAGLYFYNLTIKTIDSEQSVVRKMIITQ